MKDKKICDYKTGAIWHRIANKDQDPRSYILLKRHKMMNRLKLDQQSSAEMDDLMIDETENNTFVNDNG